MKAHVRNGKQARVEWQRKWDEGTARIDAILAELREQAKREAERASSASEENRR